jgi:SagB-type dehydrogenase family enzyme
MRKSSECKVRVSRHFRMWLNEGRYLGENVLVGQKRVIPPGIVTVLPALKSPISSRQLIDALLQAFPGTALAEAAADELLRAGIVVTEGSELDKSEESFANWVWSSATAEHFLASRRVRWLAEEAEVQKYACLLQSRKPPALWDDILDADTDWQPLGIDVRARKTFKIFERRRTVRQFNATKLSMESLGAILCAGLGIQDFLDLPLRLVHPLRFTPSPGGLNALSAYVFSKKVAGLERGVFQYSALRNQLRMIGALPNNNLSLFFGNQNWADDAAAVCVLCADYRKMAWKYSDESAFNSLLIECGHVAQNMMVCAASLCIGSAPTNAIDQPEVERQLQLKFPDCAALYAIAFGHKDVTRPSDHYSAEALSKLRAQLGAVYREPGSEHRNEDAQP